MYVYLQLEPNLYTVGLKRGLALSRPKPQAQPAFAGFRSRKRTRKTWQGNWNLELPC